MLEVGQYKMRFDAYTFLKYCDMETRVRGSLEMTLIGRIGLHIHIL